MKDITILGVSAYYHDSAAALIRNGEIIAAAQEERFTRKKGDNSFPKFAVEYCLDSAGLRMEQVTHTVYYEEPFLKFTRILANSHMTAPAGFSQYIRAVPPWITDKLRMNAKLKKELGTEQDILFCSHHDSHAASAFFPSPFKQAAILTVDGVGEWATTTLGTGEDNTVKILKEIRYPNSLGLLYSAFTYFCGFKINSGEYKLMGLAPYGEPEYAELIKKELIDIAPDGSFAVNQRFFNYTLGVHTINRRFEKLFGFPTRQPESAITKQYIDAASSIQQVTEEILVKLALNLKELTGCKNLVMAGGVALNVKAAGEIKRRNIFDDVWIQPAAGDAGGALGAALYYYHNILGAARKVTGKDSMKLAFLGPAVSKKAVAALPGVSHTYREDDAARKVAELLAAGKTVAVALGRMEFGPRALGHRSILCDARNVQAQQTLNLKIKFREDFRPFAPIVLEEDAGQYFKNCGPSPYMTFTYYVNEERRLEFRRVENLSEMINTPRSDIPAVTHVDYSARVQTVNEENPFLYKVLKEFKKLTSCSVLVNTSFNVRGEPIVCTAEDAYNCFMRTGIDYALIGGELFDKTEQPAAKSEKWAFKPD